MTSIQSVCDGIFTGQLIGSHCDPSGLLAFQLSESLLELGRFDGPVVLSKYLYTYHKRRCPLGNIIRLVHEECHVAARQKNESEQFLFDSSLIASIVKSVDEKCQHATATCGPAHRSFPLALCPWIADADLFQVSLDEAALTHHDPIAGQVSGLVNLICRSMLRKKEWQLAVEEAFGTARLHDDVAEILFRYIRWTTLSRPSHPSYAPAALNAALYYVQKAEDFQGALDLASDSEDFHVVTLVGILAGARWGNSNAMRAIQGDQLYIRSMRDMANRFANLWKSKVTTTKA